MKSKASKRRLERISKQIKGGIIGWPLFSRGYHVIVPDTSALIDIVQLSRYCNGEEEKYKNPIFFMQDLEDSRSKILICDKIFSEIQVHKKVKRNGRTRELPPDFVDYLETIYERTGDFFRQVRYGADFEQTREDVYWASILSCNENKKKSKEGFSEADKELLAFGGILSKSSGEDKKINLVSILSSDDHIICGANFLKNNVGYSQLNCINTKK